MARAPELVEQHVNRDRCWAHRRRVLDDSGTMLNLFSNPYGPHGGRPPEIVDRAIHEVLGVAFGLLARYGFGAPDPAHARFDWTDAMNAALGRYAELFGDLKQLNVDLLPALRRVADTEARRLWEKA